MPIAAPTSALSAADIPQAALKEAEANTKAAEAAKTEAGKRHHAVMWPKRIHRSPKSHINYIYMTYSIKPLIVFEELAAEFPDFCPQFRASLNTGNPKVPKVSGSEPSSARE